MTRYDLLENKKEFGKLLDKIDPEKGSIEVKINHTRHCS